MFAPPILRKVALYSSALINIIRREVNRLEIKAHPECFIRSLQRQGVDIADDAIIFGEDLQIDMTRPSLIHIGSKTFLHNGLKLLTHDYATKVFLTKYNCFVPSSGKIWIGDNVWFGENVTVLKGSTIGNDCIIGINSVVMGNIPAGSVAAGCPAKVICSTEEYFEKRKTRCVKEAFEYARSIQERYHRLPVPSDFYEEFPLFVSGNDIDNYPDIPIKRQLGSSFDYWKKHHKAPYNSFNEFISAAGIK